MPRGRHRHSPPLHRLLPPSAIAGVSFVCAFGPWVFTQQAALRVVAAAAAATAIVGAAVMRRWDTQAGKQVADLTRARASDEWRHEERVAELETDLEESRELRAKLEQRLRAKRAELAGLRNEHAALLRRYATAETERASALEGRRLLEIEAGAPTRALPPVPTQDTADTDLDADIEAAESEAAESEAAETEAVAASADAEQTADAEDDEDAEDDGAPAEGRTVFSPEGSHLFLRAKAALKRFDEDEDGSTEAASAEDAAAEDGQAAGSSNDDSRDDDSRDDDSRDDDSLNDDSQAADSQAAESLSGDSPSGDSSESEDGPAPEDDGSPKGDGPKGDRSRKREPVKAKAAAATSEAAANAAESAPIASEAAVDGGTGAAAQEDEAQGQPVAVDGHERAAATTPARHAPSAQQPAGHFVAPTAVAVVPAAPTRPAVEGQFDFFGTKAEPSPKAIEAVQNEDLADVVGEEALALHKAEAEAEFKPAGEETRDAGQVIDLTAHDETEQIDVQGLRSAVS
ncbi:hypothetical protein [Streptomyces sp. NPDC050534]|uniref:hypothetical protein n=1 Tax=Streptomyces sp. NPDC050534 TaxID=3365625 RepID=UPI0037B78AC2